MPLQRSAPSPLFAQQIASLDAAGLGDLDPPKLRAAAGKADPKRLLGRCFGHKVNRPPVGAGRHFQPKCPTRSGEIAGNKTTHDPQHRAHAVNDGQQVGLALWRVADTNEIVPDLADFAAGTGLILPETPAAQRTQRSAGNLGAAQCGVMNLLAIGNRAARRGCKGRKGCLSGLRW